MLSSDFLDLIAARSEGECESESAIVFVCETTDQLGT